MESKITIQEGASVRFYADRLPVSKQPIVVMEAHEGSSGLDWLDSHEIFLILEEEAPLQEARDLAHRLNDSVRYVSTPGRRDA